MLKWLKKRIYDSAYYKGYNTGYDVGAENSSKSAFAAGYSKGKEEANGNLRCAYDNEIKHLKWVISKLESNPEGERDGDIAQQNVAIAAEDWLYGAWQKVAKDDIQVAQDELLEVLINKLRELARTEEFWIFNPVDGDRGQVTVGWKIAIPHLEPEKDYKQRMVDEYWQVKQRYNKLHDMCIKYAAGTLDFTPTCSLELLTAQKAAMGKYLHCLEVRAQIEGVRL